MFIFNKNNKIICYRIIEIVSLPGHHVHELGEVDSAGAVLVHLRDDVLQLLLGQVRVYLAQDLLQDLRADVSLPVFVINPK